MFKFLTRRYSLIRLETFQWFFSLAGPLITFVYILGWKPFGFRLFDDAELIKLAFFYTLPAICIWILHMRFIRPLIIRKLNPLNTVLFLAWINLVIGFYDYTFSEIYIFQSLFDWYFLPDSLYSNLMLGGFITGLMVIVHAGYLIRKRVIRKKREWKFEHVLPPDAGPIESPEEDESVTSSESVGSSI